MNQIPYNGLNLKETTDGKMEMTTCGNEGNMVTMAIIEPGFSYVMANALRFFATYANDKGVIEFINNRSRLITSLQSDE